MGDYGILSDDEEVEEKECDRTPDYKPAQRDVEEVEADEKEESSTQSEAEKKHTPRKSPAGKWVGKITLPSTHVLREKVTFSVEFACS